MGWKSKEKDKNGSRAEAQGRRGKIKKQILLDSSAPNLPLTPIIP
jgi:hypothetical protein